MGTLMGHLLPGSFFVGFSLWWTWAIFTRYYKSQDRVGKKRAEPFMNTSSYSCGSKFPVEGIVKLFVITTGILGETITGFENGQFVHLGNAQHITMFFFFAITGLFDILYFYKFAIPEGLDYFSAFLAYGMEALLFANHLHGRTPMDVQVHCFLLYAVIGCVASTLAELKCRTSVIAGLSRSLFTLVQGLWFCSVGCILYPPPAWAPWNQEDHEQMMNITTLYAWHYIFAFFLMMIVGSVASVRLRKCSNVESMVLEQYSRVSDDLSEDEIVVVDEIQRAKKQRFG